MRLLASYSLVVSSLLLSACMHKGTNPADPYEPINREVHKFNMAFDATMLKPPAKLYKAMVPVPVRASITNAFNNVLMLPTVANDILQGEGRYAIKDSWRFLINSTFGVGGLFDVAASRFSLPPHYNDLGLTFAKWGNKKSPYIVLPLLGPSTIRDAMGLPFDYLCTPYFYFSSNLFFYSIGGVRYVDIRSQLLETEPLLNEALDQYSFIRDAYLQHRNFQITGEQPDTETSDYIDAEEGNDYISAETTATPTKTSTIKGTNATHSPTSTRNST